MRKRCLITYARNGREHYAQAIKRLVASAVTQARAHKENLSIIAVSPDCDAAEVEGVPINRKTFGPQIPDHTEVPYGFKPHLFRLAFQAGYDQVIWCDSTIVIRGPLDPIFDIAAKRGLFVGDNPGCPESWYCSDDALARMGCTAEKAAGFNQIMACCLAFDLGNQRGRLVWQDWWNLCNDGVTFAGRSGSQRPEFRGHRHDQAALSFLCQKWGIEYTPYGRLAYYADRDKFPENLIVNQGVYEK